MGFIDMFSWEWFVFHHTVVHTLRPAPLALFALVILLAVQFSSGSVFVTRLGGVARMRGLLRESAVRWHAACMAALVTMHTAGWVWGAFHQSSRKLGTDDGRLFDVLFLAFYGTHLAGLAYLHRRGMSHTLIPMSTLAWTATGLNAFRLYSEVQFVCHGLRWSTADKVVRVSLAGCTTAGAALIALLQGRMAPDWEDASLQQQLLADGQQTVLEARSRSRLVVEHVAAGARKVADAVEAAAATGARQLSHLFGVA